MRDHDYKAVVLDLFDTLVTWDPSLLPMVQWHGREFRSTTPILFPILQREFGERFDRERFMDAHSKVYEEVIAEKVRDGIEITCHQRFTRTLERIGIEYSRAHRLAEELRREHMKRVRAVTSAPEHRLQAVKRLRARYRLGLLSNFDDAATGHEIMHDTGVRELFDLVVISAEVGMRKPNLRIFEHTSRALGLEPGEILFVGDTPHEDVIGAKRAGMAVAWINKHGKPFPEGIAEPDLVINDLGELPERLGC
jgi:HAD superfamily hydrolase (TIGR01549 family)